jgi:release factor glutamine methyltransferase
LQYVLGEAPFRELTLKVDPRVLIPRPETELLVDFIVEHIAPKPQGILDLGTGSGAIALALGRTYPTASILAVDRSLESLALAKENAQRCGIAGQMMFLESDWFSAVDGVFDLIVSNPPYLAEKEWEEAQPEVRLFEPKGALAAANEGLQDLETIMRQAPAYLAKSGMLALETGIAHHEHLNSLAQALTYRRTLSLKDDSGRDRFFFAWI